LSEIAIAPRTTGYKVGWGILFGISALSILNHVSLAFVEPDEAVLFIGWTAFNLYSTLVLYLPYRAGAKWAWYATWIMIVTYALMILFDSQVGLFYLVAAGLMAVGQLLTRDAFFSGK
jgi:hypothetical protein